MPNWEVQEPPPWLEAEPVSGLPDVIPAWLLEEAPLPPEPAWAAAPDPLLTLQRAAADVCRLDPTAVSPTRALAELTTLLGVMKRLRLHQLARLADVTDRKLHRLADHRSTTAWLRDVAPDVDRTDLRLTGKLPDLPTLSRAVDDGSVSLRAAKRVVRALGQVRRHLDAEDRLIDGQQGDDVIGAVALNVVDLVVSARRGLEPDSRELDDLVVRAADIARSSGTQLERLDAAFTLLAEEVPAGDLVDLLDRLVLSAVPSLLEQRAAQAEDLASLSLERRSDGRGWHLEGELDHECGERLFTALTGEVHRDPDNADDTEAWRALRDQGLAPDDAEPAERPRARRRRMHDALSRLLERHLEAGLAGSHHKLPLVVNVTLPADAIDGRSGALPPMGDSGAPLPRALVRRWWCDARVTAFFVRRGGTVVGTAHAGRTLTAIERRAALIQHDNRCAGVGCCRGRPDPLRPLRPHHVQRFAEDGLTWLEDTVMICDTLHHDLHAGGRTVLLRDGRRLREQGWVDPEPPF